MDLKPFYRASVFVLVAQVLIAVAGFGIVEPGAEVPIHWGPDGQPNGYAPPIVAFLLVPLITLGLVGLLAVIPRIEPRKAHLEASADSYRAMAIGLLLFMAALQLIVVAAGVGRLA